ncbi:class I adenylate-forming enzyme family protein [Tomitella biformata]|uniref:class I adenylate-forming enzyme family protein n=1 Tax=Tomitella biformata TaxID=630403 RepID=UPI000466360B|nr:class I adenylate-forming enzyme family protein [Tomitella biformata]
MATDMQAAFAALIGNLTGPGGEFELVKEQVLGAPLTVMRNRERSLADVFAKSERFADADYLVSEEQRVSFAQHTADVRALAHSFAEQYGIGKGDRVAILGANSPQWVEVFWATQVLGAIAVGFNAWWSPPEVAHALDDSTPKLLVVDRKRLNSLGEVDIPVLCLDDDIPRLAAAHTGAPLPQTPIDEDDPAIILYTSGTSGRPKGAVHSNRNAIAVTDFHHFNEKLLESLGAAHPVERRYLLTSPLFHIASLHNLALPSLATGTAVVMYQGSFDPNRVLALIESERVTNWGAVPTMAKRLVESGDFDKYDTSSMTSFALASAPSSPEFKRQVRERIPFAKNSLVDSYGLTESCTGIAVATPVDLAENPGTLGRPTLTVEMEIRDPFGVVLPDGVDGEVCVRAPYIMLGYWNNPAATSAAIDKDRWLHTGDIGSMRDGLLYLNSRRSDLILRGGENVYPTEVEQCLDECPGVIECIVLGAPDEDLGQIVVAVVVTSESDPVTEETLNDWVSKRLAYFKRPARWRITTNRLPRNATGKIARKVVEAPRAGRDGSAVGHDSVPGHTG